MSVQILLTWWLAHVVVMTGAVLLVGCSVVALLRQPADRLKVIQWVLMGCMVAPWIPGLVGWKSVSLNLMPIGTKSVAHIPAVTAGRDDLVASQPQKIGRRVDSRNGAFAADPRKARVGDPSTENSRAPGEVEQQATVVINEQAKTFSGADETPHDSLLSTILPGLVVATYAVTVIYMLGWWLIGIWRRTALERAATVAPDALQAVLAKMHARNVQLLISDQTGGPVTWGLLRPVIVLPARFAESVPGKELRWCLAHELSHVERRDVATLLQASVVQLLCFYNPLYWWLRRQMILCQDFIADARAARETGALEDYAEFLVHLAQRQQPRLVASLGIIDRRSRLFRRVRMLLDSQAELRSKCRPAVSLCVTVGSLLLLAGLGTINLGAAETKAAAEQAVARAATTEAVPDSEPEAGVVKGTLVRASDQTPVAGAHVILRTGTAKYTNTDKAGRFRFEKVPAYPRGYEVWANFENLVTNKALVRQLPTQDAKRVKFEPLHLGMTEGKQTKFTITSQATGKPLAGAVVRFGFPDRRKVEANQDGVAIVQGLLPEEYEVIVEAEDYARATPQINLAHSENLSEYKVALVPGGVVEGVAVDSDGKPVAGVEIIYREGDGIGYFGDNFRTDAKGHFRHRFLPLNKAVTVSVSKAGFTAPSQEVVLTADQRTSNLRLTVARERKAGSGGSVTGSIVDALNHPVPGATVANYGRSSASHSTTTTDAEGKFRIDDLIEGINNYELVITAKKFAPQIVKVQPGPADHPGSVSVTLRPGHDIHGRVVNEKGEPMKQALVNPRSPQYWMQMGDVVHTDDEGRFSFESLPDDAVFSVNMPSYAYLNEVRLALDNKGPVTITLESPASVRGVVSDAETSEPVRQFRVRVRGGGDYQWYKPGLTFGSKDGRFAIAPLLNRQSVELTIEAEGYNREVISSAVAAKEGKGQELKVSLKRAQKLESSTLKGRVVDYSGKPASGAHLRLIVSPDQPTGMNDNRFNWVLIQSGQLADKPYCEQYLSCTSDRDGQFEFRNVLPGKYLQLVYWGKGVPQGRSLAFGMTEPGKTETVTITLPQPATVRGTIDRTKLGDVGSIQLTKSRESFHQYELKLADDQTNFEFDDLPPGNYWLSVAKKPERFVERGNVFFRVSPVASQELKLKPGEAKEVAFTEPDKKP